MEDKMLFIHEREDDFDYFDHEKWYKHNGYINPPKRSFKEWCAEGLFAMLIIVVAIPIWVYSRALRKKDVYKDIEKYYEKSNDTKLKEE